MENPLKFRSFSLSSYLFFVFVLSTLDPLFGYQQPMFSFLIFISFIPFSKSLCDVGWIETSNSSCVKIPEAFPPNPTILSPFCAPGWSFSQASNKCFRIFHIQLSSYRLAEELCESFNASLAVILEEHDQSFLYELSTRGWSPEIDPDSGNYAWLGLFKQDHLYWVFFQDHTRINAAFWAKDLVDNAEKECGIYDPTVAAKNEILGGLKQTECEGSKEAIGNVICEQDVLFSTSTHVLRHCDHDWHYYKETGLCYKVLQGSFSAEERKDQCKQHKSSLLHVKSVQEMDFVANLLTSGWRLPTKKDSKNLVWVGSVTNPKVLFNESGENRNSLCYTLDPQSDTNLHGKRYLGEVGIEGCDSHYTHFICSKENIHLEVASSDRVKMIAIFAITSIISFSIVTVLSMVIYKIKYSKNRHRPSFIRKFSIFSNSSSSTEAYPLLFVENSLNMRDIKLIETMGSGHFGCVFSGEVTINQITLKIAVKRCRLCGDQEQLKILSSELTAMSKLPIHPNVVALIGSVTTELKKNGQLYIAMELCDLKSLHSFVSKFQNSHYVNELEKDTKLNIQYYNISEEEYGYMNSTDERKSFAANELRTTDLLVFSVQIANGLCHLADNRCIHRDLAARNILLTSNFICKISDFGLARFVEPNYYNTQTITDSDSETLPLRWMAPESLENNVFSFATDVWSFGIVLFELFSLGKQPYFKFSQNELRNAIISGDVNERPEFCHDEIYDLMKRCWNREVRGRPSIRECNEVLKEHLRKAFPARSDHLDVIIKKEATRQQEIKNLCITRTYYNS